MKPTLSSLLAWYVVTMTTSNAASDYEVGIMATVGFQISGGRLNVKMLSYQYMDPHVKDRMVPRPSYI